VRSPFVTPSLCDTLTLQAPSKACSSKCASTRFADFRSSPDFSGLRGTRTSKHSHNPPDANAPHTHSKYDPLPEALRADAEDSRRRANPLAAALEAGQTRAESKYDPLSAASDGRESSPQRGGTGEGEVRLQGRGQPASNGLGRNGGSAPSQVGSLLLSTSFKFRPQCSL
jgi:hypothetical protein